ncbi:hypothetical protein Pmani_002050 [Petrolisthes manimaculis]|uniref:THAP9-like helix-turn-helix domain-containing protein n=1 Tax=Petrolisthes manimaculis TaxID=1843537 RepID=A0AAE1QJ75_9EUCA|nr:hypothetical protein Pmani_002050 [Petrolisthes manimaculis]
MNPSLTQISVVFTPPKLFIAGDMPGNCTTDEAAGSTERLQRAKNRGIKRSIEDMMSNIGSGISGSSNKCSVIEKDDVQSCDESVSNQPSETDKTISPLSEEQQLKINYLEEENEILKKENQELKSTVTDLLTNRSQMYSYSELENLLTPVFSKTQLDALLNKKKIKRWPDEDVSAAFTLRSFSPKCYEYLRKKKGISIAL